MKKYGWYALTCGLTSLITVALCIAWGLRQFTAVMSEDAPPPVFTAADGGITPRRTNIMVTDGTHTDVLNSLTYSAITSVNGAVTLHTDPLRLGTSNGWLRYSSSHVEYSDNSGTNYYPVYRARELLSPIPFQNASGQLRWDSTTQALQYSNDKGGAWSDIGSGAGGYALQSPSNADYALLGDEQVYSFLEYSTLQISVFANHTALDYEESLVWLYETENDGCTMLDFRKSDSNRLLYTQGTAWTPSCGFTTYSSPVVFTADTQNRWVEYAVQVNEGGNVTFYVDGVAVRSTPMTTTMYRDGTTEAELALGDSWYGGLGPVKIGNLVTWPTTGWKGISQEMQTFPGLVFGLPLTEGQGATATDIRQGLSLYRDYSVTWEEVLGGF